MVRYFPLAPLFSLSLLAHALLVSSPRPPPLFPSLPPTSISSIITFDAAFCLRLVTIATTLSSTRLPLQQTTYSVPFVPRGSPHHRAISNLSNRRHDSRQRRPQLLPPLLSRPRFPTNPTRHRTPIDHLTYLVHVVSPGRSVHFPWIEQRVSTSIPGFSECSSSIPHLSTKINGSTYDSTRRRLSLSRPWFRSRHIAYQHAIRTARLNTSPLPADCHILLEHLHRL
jgi:hypothetical protein